MPRFTHPIGPQGPMVDILIWSIGLEDPIPGKGLIDTGASHTSIDSKLAEDNGFHEQVSYRGTKSITAGGVRTDTRSYYCRLEIVGPQTYTQALAMPDFKAHNRLTDIAISPHIVLIGRDVLNLGLLTYDGPNGTFTLDLP